MMVLSPLDEKALDAIATYRLLSVELMQRLNVGKDPKHIRKRMGLLAGAKMVGHLPATFLPGYGRLPGLYWLDVKGAEWLGERDDTPPPPVKWKQVETAADLPHRLAIVAAHIAFRQWAESAGVSVDWFKADFEPGEGPKNGQGPKKATTIIWEGGRYTPDALAQVTLADGKARMLVLEVYRGGRKGTLAHFRKKLPELRAVAEAQALEKHHGLRTGVRFLVLFDNEDMRASALTSWSDASARVWGRFFVKSMDELSGDLNAAWWRPGGLQSSLF